MTKMRHPFLVSFLGLCTLPPCILTGARPCRHSHGTAATALCSLAAPCTCRVPGAPATMLVHLRHTHCPPPLLPPPAEYCARGSLYDVLRQGSQDPSAAAQLTVQRRLGMAFDAARGLLYLHARTPQPIIHQDVRQGVSCCAVLCMLRMRLSGRTVTGCPGACRCRSRAPTCWWTMRGTSRWGQARSCSSACSGGWPRAPPLSDWLPGCPLASHAGVRLQPLAHPVSRGGGTKRKRSRGLRRNQPGGLLACAPWLRARCEGNTAVPQPQPAADRGCLRVSADHQPLPAPATADVAGARGAARAASGGRK